MDVRILLTAGLVLAGTGAVAAAQTGAASTIGSFKQWTAYTSSESDGRMCFIAAQPTDSKYAPSKPKARDPAYFMVTIIPTKKIKNEASTIIGYAFKDGSKVTVDVEGKKFTMFTDKDNAWIENQAQEASLISAMKGAKTMIVEGVSKRGTTTTDTYSLSGLSSALDAIAKACAGK
jgi:invasion protein IalB